MHIDNNINIILLNLLPFYFFTMSARKPVPYFRHVVEGLMGQDVLLQDEIADMVSVRRVLTIAKLNAELSAELYRLQTILTPVHRHRALIDYHFDPSPSGEYKEIVLPYRPSFTPVSKPVSKYEYLDTAKFDDIYPFFCSKTALCSVLSLSTHIISELRENNATITDDIMSEEQINVNYITKNRRLISNGLATKKRKRVQ